MKWNEKKLFVLCVVVKLGMLTISPSVSLVARSLFFRIQLAPDDEFILLGCDGIWDCLSNEKAVAYVRSRLDTCSTLNQICREMLDDILSIDPRVTQGIGGDNMTLMIIDLQPQKRMYSFVNDDEDLIHNVD